MVGVVTILTTGIHYKFLPYVGLICPAGTSWKVVPRPLIEQESNDSYDLCTKLKVHFLKEM
jgi:hypothetical protein